MSLVAVNRPNTACLRTNEMPTHLIASQAFGYLPHPPLQGVRAVEYPGGTTRRRKGPTSTARPPLAIAWHAHQRPIFSKWQTLFASCPKPTNQSWRYQVRNSSLPLATSQVVNAAKKKATRIPRDTSLHRSHRSGNKQQDRNTFRFLPGQFKR